MAAERTPQTDTSALGHALAWIVRAAIRFPVAVLLLSVLAIVGSWYLARTRLIYHTSRTALLDRRSDFNRRWLAYVEEFGDREDVVVVVEGRDAQTIQPVLEELATEIGREKGLYQAVFHKLDLGKIRAKGLHYLPVEQLTALEGFLEEAEPVVKNGWALLNPATMAAAIGGQLSAISPSDAPRTLGTAQAKLMLLTESLAAALREPEGYRSPWPEMPASFVPGAEESRYLLTKNGQMGFVVLQLVPDAAQKKSFAENSESIDALRRLIAGVQQRHPEVRVGLTGLPIMENDEMRCSQSSMTMATLLSLIGVSAVLVVGFGGLRHSLMAMATPAIGVIWSLGYTTLAVGHLNILSSAFGAILVGLGIDYSTYFVARYLQLRAAGHQSDEALVATAQSVGPGITTGAASTAIAFFAAGFTEFTGVAELGLVAGGGIVLCWLAAMTTLPAMAHLCDTRCPHWLLPTPLDFNSWIRPARVFPFPVLVLAAAGTAALASRIDWDNFDNNLLNLQPAGLESVELERKLLAETDESAWFALSIASSPEELLARKAAFLKLPSVQRVDEIVSMFPAHEEQRLPIIRRIAARVSALPEQAPEIPLMPALQLQQMLLQGQRLMATSPHAERFRQRLRDIGEILQNLPEQEYYARLREYQQRVAEDLLARLRALRAVADPEPPQLADLPPGLVARFVGRTGRHLLRIYSKGDIWNPAAMRQFVEDVRKVDPEATGNPLQVYEASLQMKRSYEQATKYALLTIIPVVFFNFRSLHLTLLAILPLVLAMFQLYGLTGILGIPRNPANLIALPLMLGMGVDNGVHIMHDYLHQRGRYRMSPSTSTAVVLNTLTTMVGFAVLILADHRGLQSLGRVLTIGMGCCLLSSLVVLPALLTWLTRDRLEPSGAAATAHELGGPRPHWLRGRSGRQGPARTPDDDAAVRGCRGIGGRST